MLIPPSRGELHTIHGYKVVIYTNGKTYRAVWFSRDNRINWVKALDRDLLIDLVKRTMLANGDIE